MSRTCRHAKRVRNGSISYGLSSFGYDGDEYNVFTDVHRLVVCPKAFDSRSFVDIRGDHCTIPRSFALAATMEYFRIPSDVLHAGLRRSLE